MRHVDEQFDLDLTYITDRIIGMTEFVNCYFFPKYSVQINKKMFPASSGICFITKKIIISSFFETHFRIKTSDKKQRFDLSEIIFKL